MAVPVGMAFGGTWKQSLVGGVGLGLGLFLLFDKLLDVVLADRPSQLHFRRPLMETLMHLIDGFGVALSPMNLMIAAFGAFLGTVVGMLPGLGPINGVAILMPLAFALKLPPETALILLAAVYVGCEYGGRISSILLNVPGDAGAIMTTLDGYPMARKGLGGVALSISAWSSFIGSDRRDHRHRDVRAAAGALGAGLRPGRVLRADVLCLCLHRRPDGRRADEGGAGGDHRPVAVDRRARLQLGRLPLHRRRRAPVRRHPVHRRRHRRVLGQRDPADARTPAQQRRHDQGDRPQAVQLGRD